MEHIHIIKVSLKNMFKKEYGFFAKLTSMKKVYYGYMDNNDNIYRYSFFLNPNDNQNMKLIRVEQNIGCFGFGKIYSTHIEEIK